MRYEASIIMTSSSVSTRDSEHLCIAILGRRKSIYLLRSISVKYRRDHLFVGFFFKILLY